MTSFADHQIEIPSNATAPEVQTTCPKCSRERRKKNAKCLSVNVEKKTWCCHHCGWTGGLNSSDSRPQEPNHWKKPNFRKPDPRPSLALPQNIVDWFHARGITDSVLLRNRIDFGRAYFPQIEDYAEATIFPYYRASEVVNRKYRAVAEKIFRQEVGCEKIPYGFDDIDADKPLIWVEGELDKLAIEVAGFRNCVSVPDGAPSPESKNYESKFEFLENAKDKLELVKTHIIAVDSDAPGKKLQNELVRRLGVERCSRVTWPENVKDANELLIKHGPDELAEYLLNPEPFPIAGAVEVDDVEQQIFYLYENGFAKGVRTGWRALDKYFSVKPGEVTAVTGIPNHGKSNAVDSLLINLARLHGWNGAIFSPENLPLEQHMAALAEKYCGKPFHAGPTPRMSFAELQSALAWVREHFTWILPDNEDQWTVENILEIAGQLCLRKGIRALCIDPWNELESFRPSGMTETEYISQSLKRIRVFARRRGIHVFIVIHPTKLYRDDSGKYPVPTLYDCAGSAHWRNKSDNGIVVWRDLSAETAEVHIHVQKIRFRHVGKLGMCTLYYEPVCATYSDFPPSNERRHWSDN